MTQQNSSTLKNQKPMILIEFIKIDIVTKGYILHIGQATRIEKSICPSRPCSTRIIIWRLKITCSFFFDRE